MKKLLTLKHWQLFLPMIIPIIPFQMLFMMAKPGMVPEDAIPVAIALGVMVVGDAILFAAWLYAAAINLHKHLPEAVPMSLTRFKIFFFIPVLYTLSALVLVPLLITKTIVFTHLDPAFILLIVPLHLFCMFCIFYCFYFSAKCLKAVEVQGPMKSDAFIGELFLIWYFPIGVWFLQPRMNKLFNVTNDQI
jgi:hypothetical protein